METERWDCKVKQSFRQFFINVPSYYLKWLKQACSPLKCMESYGF